MRISVNSECFYINSLNRIEGNSSTFTYKLNSDISRYDRVVILDASIPKSFYIINSRNNYVIIDENGTDRTVTLPDGNYTRTSFINVLTTQLNTGAPSGWSYTISNSSSSIQDNGKLTYIVTGNSGVQPIFKFPAIESIYEQMGFDLLSENEFISDTLISSNVINLAQESTIFLRSDICESNNSDNILQSFMCASNSMFSIFNFVNPDPIFYSKKLSNSSSNIFKFWLSDENGTEISLNGLQYQFTMCLYKENRIDEIISNYIKYSIQKN